MRWVLYPIAALLALAILGLATLAAVSLFAWPNLPSLESLTDYRPRIPLRVYTSDGHLLAEFGEERRDVVRIAEVPLKALVIETLPFLAMMVIALAMITIWPDLVLWLPRQLGYQG